MRPPRKRTINSFPIILLAVSLGVFIWTNHTPSPTATFNLPSKPSTLPKEAQQQLDSFCYSASDRAKWNCSVEWAFVDNLWSPHDRPFHTVFSKESPIATNGRIWVSAHESKPTAALHSVLLKFPHLQEQWRVLRFNNASAMMSMNHFLVDTNTDTAYAVRQCQGFEYIEMQTAIFMSVVGTLKQYQRKDHWTFRVLIIGLGGGSMPLLLAKHFPQSQIDAVEIEPIVIDAAHDAFGLPRLRNIKIIHSDAQEYLTKVANDAKAPKYDFILFDAYDGSGANGEVAVPKSLKAETFGNTIAKALHPEHGTLIVNFLEPSPEMQKAYVSALLPASQGYATTDSKTKIQQGYCFQVKGPNTILMCSRGLTAPIDQDRDITRKKLLQQALRVGDDAGICQKPEIWFKWDAYEEVDIRQIRDGIASNDTNELG